MERRNIFKVFELDDIRYDHEDTEHGDSGIMIEDVSVQPSESHRPTLLFDYRHDKVQIINKGEKKPTFHVRGSFLIYGIVGAIQLISTRFLLVITESSSIGDIARNTVYKVSKIQLVKISERDNQSSIRTSANELYAANQRFINAIESLIQRHDFYYSDTIDLTSYTQRSFHEASTLDSEYHQRPQIRNANRDFVWNYYLAEQLTEEKLDLWITPIIDGFIKIVYTTWKKNLMYFALISRRSCMRTGMRYRTRGIDHFGNAANFVETEQIVIYNNHISSFVQTRGSIPLLWEQRQHKLGFEFMFSGSKKMFSAFRSHFEKQIREYGVQYIINLVKHIGKEGQIADSFERHVRIFNNPRIFYRSFDFSEKCEGRNFDNVALLYDDIKGDIEEMGFFIKSFDKKIPEKIQRGVFRTNCIDCLDRTNIVQSFISKIILKKQLSALGIDDPEVIPQFYSYFNTLWVSNADYLSTQYTGSNALKTDYNISGKSTISGNINDKVNSVKRVVKYQISAGTHEEEMNIFLGNIVVDGCIKAFSTSSKDFLLPPGKTFANDNIFFTDVLKIDHFDKKILIPVILRVCESASLLSIIEPGSFVRRDYSLDGIYDIERSMTNYRQFNLYIGSHPFPISLIFPSRKKGIKFYNSLEPILFKTYPLMPGLIAKQIPLNFYVSSWNAALAPQDPNKVVAEITKGKDLYVICANNLKFKPPSEFSLSTTGYWYYILQRYLGPNYRLIGYSTTYNTSVCAFIKRDFYSIVHNTCCTTAEFLKIRSKDLYTERSEDLSVAEDVDTRDGKDESEIVGGAIHFSLNDSQMCFINMHPGKRMSEKLMHDDYYLHLKSNMDLDTCFRHAFLIGKPLDELSAKSSLFSKYFVKWNETIKIPPGLETVTYHTLTPNSSTDIECDGSVKEGNYSVSFVYNLLPMSPEQRGVLRSKVHIILTSLYCSLYVINGSESIPEDFRSYLVIEAPFLFKNGQTGISTGKKNPSWANNIVLKSFISDVKYLKGKYLKFELWNTNKTIVARAAIPLENYLTEETLKTNEPRAFSADLLYGGCKNGVLKGIISFEELPPKPKGKPLLGMNLKELMVPNYKP